MGITAPFKRTCRIFSDGRYGDSGKSQYILHPDFAESPGHFIRAFLLIQRDLSILFDFVEPSDANQNTHSFRVHELMLRTCVEVEANCTAILRENGYVRPDGRDWTMQDYEKIETSHYLSQYEVLIPNWLGDCGVRKPFDSWANENRLDWYQSYNETKHDRHRKFSEAKFDYLIDAIAGLSALIASQFWTHDFSPSDDLLSVGKAGPDDGYESSIGGFFRLKFPRNVPESERYSFSHGDIDFAIDMFQNYPYT